MVRKEKNCNNRKIWLGILGVVVGLLIAYYVNIELEYQCIVEKYNEIYAAEELSEIDRINSIREYVYTNSVFANEEELLLNGFSPKIFGLTKKEKIVKMFKLTENYKGGLYCDGFADMLAMFYQTQGYDAYRVNLNVYGNTHCVTVVKYPGYEGEWLIEDATFNTCVQYDGREVYTLEELINNLKYEKGDVISIVQGSIESCAISLSSPEEWTSMYPIISNLGGGRGRYLYKIDRGISNYSMFELMYPYFVKDGYESNYKFSLLYTENIIWKYGIEDLVIDRKRILKDIEELSIIMMGKGKV